MNTNPTPPFPPTTTQMIIATTLGVIWGLLIATFAVTLSEGGYGWNAAILYGMVALIMSPVACVLWIKRKTITLNTMIITLIVAITADIGLFQASVNEGSNAFYRSIDYVLPWLLLWISWQVLLLFTFFDKSESKESEKRLPH